MTAVAAPNYVPAKHGHSRYYESPPRRGDSWRADRPGDIPGGVPDGRGLGRQGPDQGYALKLVRQFEDKVHLASGERWEDAAAGAVLVALKRASLFGRAPVRHDLEIAFRVWGFLDDLTDDDLVELRKDLFDRVDNPHHYLEGRRIVDATPESTLRADVATVESVHARDWRELIDIAALDDVDEGADHDPADDASAD